MSELTGCHECGNVLTAEERHYYQCRCERCETDWHETVQRWRAGEDNAMLDAISELPRPTVN